MSAEVYYNWQDMIADGWEEEDLPCDKYCQLGAVCGRQAMIGTTIGDGNESNGWEPVVVLMVGGGTSEAPSVPVLCCEDCASFLAEAFGGEYG